MTNEQSAVEVEQGLIFEYEPDGKLDDPHPENELPDIETHRVIFVGVDEINTVRTDAETNATFGWESIPKDAKIIDKDVY